jgi:hypothetical protein
MKITHCHENLPAKEPNAMKNDLEREVQPLIGQWTGHGMLWVRLMICLTKLQPKIPQH